jgi:tetratricopeptide (TPR) repeat protein
MKPSFGAALTCAAAVLSCSWPGALKAGTRDCPPALPTFQRGVCLVKNGEWQQGAALLSRYAESHQTDASAWYWLAQAQLYQRQFAPARASIQHSIEIDSKSAKSYRTLGEIELQLKNNEAAYRAWIAANKLDPLDPKTTYYIGRLFFEADLINEAASWFRQTLKVDSRHFAAMTYLAICAEHLEFQSTAADLYRAAIRESKEQGKPFPWAFLSYAKYLRQSGKDREALDLLEEAERLCPEPHALALLGQMLAADQPERAETVLRRAIEMDSGIPEAHYRLAMLLRSAGRTDEADSEFQRFQEAKAAEERSKNSVQAIRKVG